MKNIILLICIVLFSSCNEERFFLDFDEVDYYAMNEKQSKDSNNEYIKDKGVGFEKIVYLDFPNTLNDTIFLSEMNSDKFRKNKISTQHIETLKNDIFVKNTSLIRVDNACAPTYRDILILKKKKKIVGIAKICMECEKYYFVGNQKNIETEDFGQNGEFDEIKEIFDTYEIK